MAKGPKERSIQESIAIARDLVAKGIFQPSEKLPNELTDLGVFGQEDMLNALKAAFAELKTDFYSPVALEFSNHPGLQFVWDSKHFQKKMCVKFSLRGTRNKPRLVIWSCHQSYF